MVSDLKAGETVTAFYLVTRCDRKNTGAGKPYLALELTDRTGKIEARYWDDADINKLDYVKAEAACETYRDQLQLKVSRIRQAQPEEVVIEDFVPASKHDRESMLAVVEMEVSCISDRHPGLRAAVEVLLGSHREKILNAPAAKSNHQPYLGGLLEHAIKLAELSRAVCKVYEGLDKDVLVAASIVHDIGKIHELVYDTHIDYSLQGSLVGHILIGYRMWIEASAEVEPAARDHVAHIIASHHGRKDWGAAVLPMTREAQVFHQLDMIDSRMGLIDTIDEYDQDGLSAYNRSLETRVWKPQ